MKCATIITDLLDPDLGSEFQIALKSIISLVENEFKYIEIWTLERGGNRKSISLWLKKTKLTNRVKVNFVPMKFSRIDGSHATRLHFLIDLYRLYFIGYFSSNSNSLLWKSGQVNFTFYLPFLFSRRSIILGPISGFEYPPLSSIARFGPLSLLIKYSFYSVLIFFMRAVFNFILNVRSNKTSILFATQIDKKAFSHVLNRKKNIFGGLCSEINLSDIIEQVSVSRGNTRESNQKGIRILWSGAMIHRKNPIAAVKAFQTLLKMDSKVEVSMVGQGPLVAPLKRLILPNNSNRLKLKSNLSREDFLTSLGSYDVVLVTSWREANSSFIFEALASGCLVVSSEVSGMRHVIGDIGETVPFEVLHNPDKMAKMLLRVGNNLDRDLISQYINTLYIKEKLIVKNMLGGL